MPPALSDDLSALAIIRDMDSFDFGTFMLPAWRRVSPWKLWHYPLAAVLIVFFFMLARGSFFHMTEAFEYGEYGAFFEHLLLTLVSGGVVLLASTLVLLSPFMDLTVHINKHWVEASYYTPNFKRHHFKEPLANYTGVLMETEVRHLPAAETLTHEFVNCVELEHPDRLRRLPLYQGNEQTARERLRHAARTLDLPVIAGRSNGRPRLERSQLLDLMEAVIATAASDGYPFSKTGPHGVFERHSELPPELRVMGRRRLRGLVAELITAGRVRRCAALNKRRRQWLDVPCGTFDRGEGKV